jgi:hypothetical protein
MASIDCPIVAGVYLSNQMAGQSYGFQEKEAVTGSLVCTWKISGVMDKNLNENVVL